LMERKKLMKLNLNKKENQERKVKGITVTK
jgi:hypothetical protein